MPVNPLKKENNSNKIGLSIIELIIAIIVISVSASGIIGLFITGFDKNTVSGDIIKAEQLASSRMEYMKNITYDSALALDNTINDYSTIYMYPDFKLTTYVRPVNGVDSTFLKIEAIVEWHNSRGLRDYKLIGAYNY